MKTLAAYVVYNDETKQVALAAETKVKVLRYDVARVKQRIEALGGTWKPTPFPTKVP